MCHFFIAGVCCELSFIADKDAIGDLPGAIDCYFSLVPFKDKGRRASWCVVESGHRRGNYLPKNFHERSALWLNMQSNNRFEGCWFNLPLCSQCRHGRVENLNRFPCSFPACVVAREPARGGPKKK